MGNTVRPTGAMPILESILEFFGYRRKVKQCSVNGLNFCAYLKINNECGSKYNCSYQSINIDNIDRKFDELDRQVIDVSKLQDETIKILKGE